MCYVKHFNCNHNKWHLVTLFRWDENNICRITTPHSHNNNTITIFSFYMSLSALQDIYPIIRSSACWHTLCAQSSLAGEHSSKALLDAQNVWRTMTVAPHRIPIIMSLYYILCLTSWPHIFLKHNLNYFRKISLKAILRSYCNLNPI